MKKNQIDFITLGCSKNLVDSEVLMKQFEANGYRCTHDSKRPQGEIAVINTCGFIGDAKEESINTILEFADAKEKGRLKKLFVMGCLSQRYKSELEKEIPQVDKYYGKFDYKQLLADFSHNGASTAENIAMGPADASTVISAWSASSGHYANMVNSGFTRGAIVHIYDGDGCHFWCATFG